LFYWLLNKSIKNGYISIKTERALKKHYDNRGWIVISSKNIKNNININDIIKMINESRGYDQ
jgi:hypothetical protein